MKAFAIASLVALVAPVGSVAWEKPEVAQAKSAATGMPICYYFTQNAAQKDGST